MSCAKSFRFNAVSYISKYLVLHGSLGIVRICYLHTYVTAPVYHKLFLQSFKNGAEDSGTLLISTKHEKEEFLMESDEQIFYKEKASMEPEHAEGEPEVTFFAFLFIGSYAPKLVHCTCL